MKEARILRLALLRRLLPCFVLLLFFLLPLLLLTKPILSVQPLSLLDFDNWFYHILPHAILVSGIVGLYSFLSFFSLQAHCGGLTISIFSLPQLFERLLVSLLVSVSLVIVLQRFYGTETAWSLLEWQHSTVAITALSVLAWWFFNPQPNQTIIMDNSTSLSCQLYTVSKRSLWHVGGKTSLLLGLVLVVVKLLWSGLHHFVIAEGVARHTSHTLFTLSHTCNMHILTYTAIQQATVLAFVFVTAVDFVRQLMALALFRPLDFTKLILQDVLQEKYSGEQYLLKSLRFLHSAKASITLVQPSSKSKAFLGGSLDTTPMYKKNLHHVQSYMEDETLKGRQQIALGQFPVLSYYAGCNDKVLTVVGNLDTNYALMLRSLAFHDLNRIARIHPHRRQELYQKHWNDIFDVCITNIASFVIQVSELF